MKKLKFRIGRLLQSSHLNNLSHGEGRVNNWSTIPTRCLIRFLFFFRFRRCPLSLGVCLSIITSTIVLFLYCLTSGKHVHRANRAVNFDINNSSACKLPSLDPWHKSVMSSIENPAPLDCNDENSYTKLVDGVLYVSERVETFEVQEIVRLENDDYTVKYKHLNVLGKQDENETIKFLHKGFTGNIQHSNKKCFHPYGGLREPKSNTHLVLHPDCHLRRIEFEVIDKNSSVAIRHVPSALCLVTVLKKKFINEKDIQNISKVVFSKNCEPAFKLLDNGRLQDLSSGLCLQAKNVNDKEKEDVVVLKDDCESVENVLYGLEIKDHIRNITINSEFFLVVGHDKEGETFEELHLQAPPKPTVQSRPVKSKGLGLNIFMIMFDSTSAAHFHRKMLKSVEFLKKDLKTIFFKGEGIVGDGTTAQLTAMLTGIAEEKQPEARRGKPGAKSVDNWRWIYRDFKDHGYVTLLSEDDPKLGSFNLRLVGFDEPPTDHYARPFWLDLEERNSNRYCFEQQVIHNFSLSYMKSLCSSYPKRPKFALSIYSYISHDDLNTLSFADRDIVKFLDYMRTSGYHNNSMFIIFGDHGSRSSNFRKTTQGRLEERLPFLSITLPPWFSRKHPSLYANLQANSEVLTSPFDVYATLRHVLSYPEQPHDIITGQSLFNRIDRFTRKCPDAGIDTHWCPCMEWEVADKNDGIIQTIADAVLKYVNNLTSDEQLRNLCLPYKLENVNGAWKENANSKVQSFDKTVKVKDCDSCVAKFGKKIPDTLKNDAQYQIQLGAIPGPAVFEASVRMVNGHAQIRRNHISRINRYGDQPHCIKETHTHLMKYCYCKVQLTTSD